MSRPGSLGPGLQALALAVLASACKEAPPVPAGPPRLGPIVETRLAALAAHELAEVPAAPVELAEETLAMLETRVHGGQFADLVLEDVRALGAQAIAPLASQALDPRLEAAQRAAALELLAALQRPEAAERLLALTTTAPEPWVRAHAAWRLASAGSDHVVPRLVLRLKYEKDPDAFLWVASTLARLGSLAGLGGLIELAGREDARASTAAGELAFLEEQLGMAPQQALAQWDSPEAESLALPLPSEAQVLEVWSLVEDLSGDTFALRPVDDARYILCRLGGWCAHEVSQALLDQDPWVRLHSAQVLELMGPRARAVEGSLRHVLAEPGVAPAAAEALGRVGGPASLPDLIDATSMGTPHELRVAAVRALGVLALPEGLPTIQALFDDSTQPGDLRMAAARSLVSLDQGQQAAAWLVERLAEGPDASEAEVALGAWLQREAAATRTGFGAALKQWETRSDPPGTIPSTERAIERRQLRATDLAQQLSGLLAPE